MEIYGDGTLSMPRILMGADPTSVAEALPMGQPLAATLDDLSPALQSHLGRSHTATGELLEAARALAIGARAAAASTARESCLGQLALVEAFRGDLRRADARADLVLTTTHSPDGDGAVHARVAKAWIHLERDELVEARQCLDGVGEAWEWGHDPWLSMNRLLAEARLLMALRQPDAASRLLALNRELDTRLSTSGWIADLLATERADTLLAAGEPQRALAALTPLPQHTVVEATLVAAAARRDIGDFRGAQAVLNTVTSDLERSPLSLLIRAQLLEAALAQTRGQRPRARLLVDRALHSACLEEMRTPITREWRWLLSCVNQDPALARSHRSFLSTLDFGPTVGARRTPSPAPERLDGQALTERERQVLDLLALMCSTEEIARALYVSPNTVKTHLKGLFGKLDVNRRVDAVRRGRQLGLC